MNIAFSTEPPETVPINSDWRGRHQLPHAGTTPCNLIEQYQKIRSFTVELCKPLEVEDYVIQSMKEASPIKWHLAHTSWFFETFVLKCHFPNYESLYPDYSFLFNSHYNSVGHLYDRAHRGLLSRSPVKEILNYRAVVDLFISDLFEEANGEKRRELEPLIVLGLMHEEQHQELMLCNNYLLRGGSCATQESHIRRTYRNFFPLDTRRQFSGIRLAKDLQHAHAKEPARGV